jgi:hypothetical protein
MRRCQIHLTLGNPANRFENILLVEWFDENRFHALLVLAGLVRTLRMAGNDDISCVWPNVSDSSADFSAMHRAFQPPSGDDNIRPICQASPNAFSGAVGYRYFVSIESQRACQDIGKKAIILHN